MDSNLDIRIRSALNAFDADLVVRVDGEWPEVFLPECRRNDLVIACVAWDGPEPALPEGWSISTYGPGKYATWIAEGLPHSLQLDTASVASVVVVRVR